LVEEFSVFLFCFFFVQGLARAYMKVKKFDLAHKEQQRVVEDLLAHLLTPERSSVTLTRSLLIAKENLAIIYWHLGEPAKAEKLHVEVLVDIGLPNDTIHSIIDGFLPLCVALENFLPHNDYEDQFLHS